MSNVMLSKEKLDYTIDLLITMTVEEIAANTGYALNDALYRFLSSKTGEALYDVNTGLWCNGPSYLAELYMDEVACRTKQTAKNTKYAAQSEVFKDEKNE